MKNILKKFAATVIPVLILSFAAVSVITPPSVSAQKEELCGGASLSLSTDSCSSPCTERKADGSCAKHDTNYNAESRLNKLIKSIVDILSVIIGIIAVIFVIIGGFKFITSGGDSGKVASARSTVIYAIVGLIVVALAQVLVRFVLNKVA